MFESCSPSHPPPTPPKKKVEGPPKRFSQKKVEVLRHNLGPVGFHKLFSQKTIQDLKKVGTKPTAVGGAKFF